MKLGFHIPFFGSLKKLASLVGDTRGNSFQFYSRNIRGGAVMKFTDKHIVDYYEFLFEKRVSSVVMVLPLYYKKTGNTKISSNLAVENPELIEEILIDLENAKQFQAKYFVVHTGYYKESTEEEGIKWLMKNLNEILERTSWGGTILVRNPAGGGTEVAADLFNFAKIVNSSNKRIKAALDFGRLWSAGYNLINDIELKIVLEILKNEIGFENIMLVYVNDSNRFCGSKKDEPVPLGEGVIGYAGYYKILNTGLFKEAIKMIENHQEDGAYYDKVIKFLLDSELE